MNLHPRYGNYWICTRQDGAPLELGRGTLGVTYKAEDTESKRSVALKIIDAGRFTKGQQERLVQDVRTAAQLRNRRIAEVDELGSGPAEFYYATEFVLGRTLRDVVEQGGPIPPALALSIAYQVSEALEAAESRGLVHGDIRPANVVISQDKDEDDGGPAVKVLDFGLRTGALASNIDKPREAVLFSSPEKMGGRAVDPRADIYALGCTLWYSLTGASPFAASGVNRGYSTEPSWDEIRRLPRAVRKLLTRMLARDPNSRQQSAAALRREILYCWAGAGRKQALVRQAVETGGAAGSVERFRPAPGRKLALASAVALLALLGITWGAAELRQEIASTTPASGGESAQASPVPQAKGFARTAAMDKEFLEQQTPGGSVIPETTSRPAPASTPIEAMAAATPIAAAPIAPVAPAAPVAPEPPAAPVESLPRVQRSAPAVADEATAAEAPSRQTTIESTDSGPVATTPRHKATPRVERTKQPDYTIALAGSANAGSNSYAEKPARTDSMPAPSAIPVKRAAPIPDEGGVAQDSTTRRHVTRQRRTIVAASRDDGDLADAESAPVTPFYGPDADAEDQAPPPVAEGNVVPSSHYVESRTVAPPSEEQQRRVVRRTHVYSSDGSIDRTYTEYAPAPRVYTAPVYAPYGYRRDEDRDDRRDGGFFHRLFHHHDDDDGD